METYQIIAAVVYLLIGSVFGAVFWFSGPSEGKRQPKEVATVVGLVIAWLPIIFWAIFTHDYD